MEKTLRLTLLAYEPDEQRRTVKRGIDRRQENGGVMYGKDRR